MAIITTKELHLFYKIDRDVFSFLIFNLGHDLTQSLLVMALWMWLENIGYPCLIPKVLSLPDIIVNALVNESVTCLNCLETDNPTIPSDGGLPLMQQLMQRNISIQIFNLKRHTAIAGIKSILTNTCARIFKDVLLTVLNSQSITSFTSCASTSQTNTSNTSLVVPGFPHPLFGTFDLSQKTVELDWRDERVWNGTWPSEDVTNDDRSMFLTFSRGFLGSEEEVSHFFECLYGDCVQSLTMGVVNINEQHLVAVMVLKKVETIDEILKGNNVVKLNMNGKHIWARKYE
ncbi:uncharacterized protein LOC130712281 [Lotus japonicus]|uniref:uncharacterized protein LOC130712281 n=1 Tax=Lotus japonicus TaxID=34305 RepID=UPI0025866CB6|nr:uncharacterized protein LOC130712281 [Lotus japonicus]